jgi:hypothetical protein
MKKVYMKAVDDETDDKKTSGITEMRRIKPSLTMELSTDELDVHDDHGIIAMV